MTRPSVFVAVGTDHHPFDRVIRWVDSWPGVGDADVFVQYGTSQPPARASGSDYLDFDDLQRRLADATVVVCHGGPSTIMEARRAGQLPVVVPRRPDLGEHVDGHQVAFSERLATAGEIVLARSEAELHATLSAAVDRPEPFKTAVAADDGVLETVRRFEDTVDLHLPRPVGEVSSDPVSVLLLGGVGRSGSTLLDRMLGQVDGFCSVGELVHVWLRGLKEDTLCACGEHFADCAFWGQVGERAFGGWERLDPDRMHAWHKSVDRHRYLPELIAPRINPPYRKRLDRFTGILARLYASLVGVNGCDVIVDSSKHASYAYLLRHVPNVDLRVVHLVRDPRGVAYSWTKQVVRPEITSSKVYMAQYDPAHMATRWITYNLMFEFLGKLGVPVLRVRYEDLAEDPKRWLTRILRFAGREPQPQDLSFLTDDQARLGVGHSVAGNPMRFEQGPIKVRLDRAWQEKMDPRARSVVTMLTRPLMRSYGYDIKE